MTFLGGALVGVLIGFGAAILLTLRGGKHRGDGPRPGARRSVPTVLAALALVVAAAAFVRSGRHDGRADTGGSTTTSTTARDTAPTTTPVTAPRATVSVPNVVGLARETAVEKLQNAGLHATFAALTLSNVPPGFVISQSPLPGGLVAPGAAVSLVVSSTP